MAAASPFFRSLPLNLHGLEFIHPPAPLAHPLDGGRAVMLYRSVQETASGLGPDGDAYWRLMEPLVQGWRHLERQILGPLTRVPKHPLALMRFGLQALWPASTLAKLHFHQEQARALFGGLAAHSMLPLSQAPSAAVGLVLGVLGHVAGWPIARGGSQSIAQALVSYLHSLGGNITTGRQVRDLVEIPPARAVLFDLTPEQVLQIAGAELPTGYRRQLRHYRRGPGVFKVDWALDGPIPWEAPACAQAGTVHIGGTLDELTAAEQEVGQGRCPREPFVLLAQQSLFDETRAPAGKHTVWAYCHVPNGSTVDMTDKIQAQIERFAPGFSNRILARHVMSPANLETYNANYLGGDINGGLQDLVQLVARPALRLTPYSTPCPNLYICSASTPPGGGVHGMSGHLAAKAALKAQFRD